MLVGNFRKYEWQTIILKKNSHDKAAGKIFTRKPFDKR